MFRSSQTTPLDVDGAVLTGGSSYSSASSPSCMGNVSEMSKTAVSAFPTAESGTTASNNTPPHKNSKSVTADWPSGSSSLQGYRLHCDFIENALVAKANSLDRVTYFAFYVIFVIGFCFYFLYDVDVSGRYQLRRSLLDTLAGAEVPQLKAVKLFSELSSADEYGRYITYTVAPLLANVLSPTGSSLPLGAIRVRTQRGVTIGCEKVPADGNTSLFVTIACPDSSVSSQEDTRALGETWFNVETMWRYRTCPEVGGNRITYLHGVLGTYHCGGFIFDAPLWIAAGRNTDVDASASSDSASHPVVVASASAEESPSLPLAFDKTASGTASVVPPALGTAEQDFPFTGGTLPFQRISQQVLQRGYLHKLFWGASVPFVDNYGTQMVVTEVLFYSPPLQRFATVKLMGEVTSSGSWHTTASFHTARVWTRDDIGKGVYDAVVMLLALAWLVTFLVQAVLFVQLRVAEQRVVGGAGTGGGGGGDTRKRARDATGLSYSAVATVRVMAVVEYLCDPQRLSTLVILSLLVVTAGFRIAAVVYSARSIPRLSKIIYQNSYPAQLEYLFYLDSVQLYVNAVILILLFYHGLYFVTVGTHAARAVRLLACSQSALCGYFLLSLLSTTIYALTLTTLYGHSVWGFRSVDSAFYNLLRVMMRQHDIHALTRDADEPVQVAFILFSYHILGVLTPFGFAVGVLVHNYSELRKEEPSPVIAAYQIQWLLHHVWARCLSTPRQWPWFMWRWCTGYGDAALLRHAARCLRSYRTAKYPALDHVEGELRQLVSLDEFTEAMHNFSDAWLSQMQWPPSEVTNGVWMTWTTRSSSSASSFARAAELPSGVVDECRNTNGRRSTAANNVVGDVVADARRCRASLSSAQERTPMVDRSNSVGAELVKTGVLAPAETWEVMRRRWQQRWAAYTPEQMWRDVYEDWLASTTSAASLHYREEMVWLRNGVQAAVGDNLSHSKVFTQRLDELERKLKLLESHLREKELTTATSDKADRDEKCESAD